MLRRRKLGDLVGIASEISIRLPALVPPLQLQQVLGGLCNSLRPKRASAEGRLRRPLVSHYGSA
jgi:hypothetical protein